VEQFNPCNWNKLRASSVVVVVVVVVMMMKLIHSLINFYV
jgi:hypothetical protein